MCFISSTSPQRNTSSPFPLLPYQQQKTQKISKAETFFSPSPVPPNLASKKGV